MGSWGILTVHNSTFSGNSAFRGSGATGGGAIGIFNSGDAQISSSTFVNNSTKGFAKGGAIISDGTLSVKNCTFNGNFATVRGGAIAVESGITTATNITVADNSVESDGAGFYIAGILILRNSIIAGNLPGGNCSVYGGGTIVNKGGNVRHPYSDPTCTGDYGNPRLSSLANNGGPTMTMAIRLDSAAAYKIDADGGCGAGIYYDQRGVSRPRLAGQKCSAGAYEHDSPRIEVRCFIATAAFGSEGEKYIQILRLFRDRFLLSVNWGRSFVKWYYHSSPKYAAVIAENRLLRKITSAALLPICFLAWAALYWQMTLLLSILGVSAIICLRRNK